MTEHVLENEAAARTWIVQNSKGYQRKHAVHERWQHSREFVAENFSGMTSKKEKRAITLMAMRDLFEPMADVLVRKYKHMELIEQKHTEYLAALQELKSAKDEATIQRLMKKLDEIHKKEDLLAFASKGEDQWKYQLASTYSDE